MKLIIFQIVIISVLCSACSSRETKFLKFKAHTWERDSECPWDRGYYVQGEDKNLFICSVVYKKDKKKHFPEWELDKEYMGITSRDRKFFFEPVYDHIYTLSYAQFTTFLYRKNSNQFYSRYDSLTQKDEITPIDHLEVGKLYYGVPFLIKGNKATSYYSGAFSDEMKNYYIMDRDFNIVKKIENVDNNLNRKAVFPPVHTLTETSEIFSGNKTRMIRHNLNGEIFYQVYDSKGNHVGDKIPFQKVSYFFQSTNSGMADAAYDVRPWADKGDGIYMPIVHYGENGLFDGTKEWGNFIGISVIPDWNRKYRGVFAGYQYAKEENLNIHKSTNLVFKDEIGMYYSKGWYDFHAGASNPITTIEELKKDPKNFYRTKIELVFYKGGVDSKGDLLGTNVSVYQEMDDTYTVENHSFNELGFMRLAKVNSFTSLQDIEGHLNTLQTEVVKKAKIAAENARKERQYQNDLKVARERAAATMQASWAESEQREKEHEEQLAIEDHNKKFEKPNPLLNLDFHKLIDVQSSKRKADCFRKMSDSKKKYLGGSQKWYYQGDCK